MNHRKDSIMRVTLRVTCAHGRGLLLHGRYTEVQLVGGQTGVA